MITWLIAVILPNDLNGPGVNRGKWRCTAVHERNEPGQRCLDRELRGIDDEIGAMRRLVGSADPCELVERASARRSILALGISLLASRKVGLHIDFPEFGSDDLPGAISIFLGWRNQGDNDDEAGLCKQSGHFGNAPRIFAAIFVGESKIAVDALADKVAIQYENLTAAPKELSLEAHGERGLARGWQAGQP